MNSVCFFVLLLLLLLLLGGSTSGLVLIGWCATNMSSLVKNEEVCFACLTWLYGLSVKTLISRTNYAHSGCGRLTLNFIECFVLGRSLPFRQRSHFTSCQSGTNRIICMNVNLKMITTSKASVISFETKSHSIECFCCHHYLLSGCHEDQRL